MCGRYTVFTEAEIIEMNAIVAEVSRRFGSGAVATGEIFPTNVAPILMMENNRLAPFPVFWGFPKWDKGVNINARSDTALNPELAETPGRARWIRENFTKPLLARRCVIPSTGFYEWTFVKAYDPQISLFPDEEAPPSPKDPKMKLHFKRPGESMLYMAGMLTTFADASGTAKDAFCILTTDAKHSIARFHDRMPVILSPGECEDWIASEAFMREVLARDGPDLDWKPAA